MPDRAQQSRKGLEELEEGERAMGDKEDERASLPPLDH